MKGISREISQWEDKRLRNEMTLASLRHQVLSVGSVGVCLCVCVCVDLRHTHTDVNMQVSLRPPRPSTYPFMRFQFGRDGPQKRLGRWISACLLRHFGNNWIWKIHDSVTDSSALWAKQRPNPARWEGHQGVQSLVVAPPHWLCQSGRRAAFKLKPGLFKVSMNNYVVFFLTEMEQGGEVYCSI